MKSQRFGEKVIITMARLGGPGDFPSIDTVQSERERVLQKMANEEEDKEGVSVVGPEVEYIVVPPKECKDKVHY